MASVKRTLKTSTSVDPTERARSTHLLRLYGITVAEYARLLEYQGGVCGICRTPPKTKPLHVDHDHKTKVIRGLLCFRCNYLLVSCHDVVVLQNAIAYVTSHPAAEVLGERVVPKKKRKRKRPKQP